MSRTLQPRLRLSSALLVPGAGAAPLVHPLTDSLAWSAHRAVRLPRRRVVRCIVHSVRGGHGGGRLGASVGVGRSFGGDWPGGYASTSRGGVVVSVRSRWMGSAYGCVGGGDQ